MKIYNHAVTVSSTTDWIKKAITELESNGVVVLRGLVSNEQLDVINKQTSQVLSKPSVLGSVGFYQKDPYKIIYDGFLMGKEVVNLISNEKLLDLIENYIGDRVILNEIFLKYDLGTNMTYFPYHRHTGIDVEGPVDVPFGCGTMVYLHETNDGAFCYSLNSHKLSFNRGDIASLADHEKKDKLYANLHKIVGKAGDVVLFDERGFHGPEQPTKAERKVLLFGYQSRLATSNRARTGIPVIISDLEDLNQRQLESIGIGGGARSSYGNYHARHSVMRTKKHKVFTTLIKFTLKVEILLMKLIKVIKK